MRFAITLPRSVEECKNRTPAVTATCFVVVNRGARRRPPVDAGVGREHDEQRPEPAGLLRTLDRRVRSTIRIRRSA